MQAQILAHRKAIQQALSKAHFHAEQLAQLVVPEAGTDDDDLSQVPTEDRLPFEIQCLITEVTKGLPVTVKGPAAYEKAKATFDQFPKGSFSRPDSLSRNGDVLIARCGLSFSSNIDFNIADWRDLINELFEGQVVIYDIRVDKKKNLRVRFSLLDGAPSPSNE
jgi:hypothetical protein